MSYFGNKIEFKDGPQLDSFSRLRVSIPNTLFDSQQEYGLDTLRTWDATANGTLATGSTNGSVTNGSNAVGPTDSNTRLTPVTSSSTNGHYSILQSRQYTRYVPGKSHLILITGVFTSGANATAHFVRRTSTSGSVDDSDTVAQASWNIDPFDGTGPSGITLDLTQTQILFISAQWLGVGRVIVGFDIGGVLYPAHQFLHANLITVPYTQSFNLPVRMENRNTGAAANVVRTGYFDAYNGVFLETQRVAAGGTSQFCCCSVQSEGGAEARGFPQSASNGITTIGVTTRRPILSIRPKATYNSRTNRGHIEFEEMEIVASTNDAYYELVVGGTLTGASFATVGAEAVSEFDVAATAISGGVSISKGFVSAGSGTVKGRALTQIDFRNPLTLSQIDGLTASQIPFSVVCTSFSGTSNLSAALNWHEQTV